MLVCAVGDIHIVQAGCLQNTLMIVLLQNDSFKYRHERVKQGERDERDERDERGTPPVGVWTMKDLPERSDI
jgi:hypothetical protein